MRLKKQIKLEKKRAKVERIRSKNEERVTLAKQGIQKKSGLASVIESVGKTGAALLGGATQDDASNDAIINQSQDNDITQSPRNTVAEIPKSSGNMKTIMIVGAAIVAFMMFRK